MDSKREIEERIEKLKWLYHDCSLLIEDERKLEIERENIRQELIKLQKELREQEGSSDGLASEIKSVKEYDNKITAEKFRKFAKSFRR